MSGEHIESIYVCVMKVYPINKKEQMKKKTCLLHEPVVTSSISRICRLSLSEVLRGVGLRACIHKDECVCVFMSVCVYTVFLKKLFYLATNIQKKTCNHCCYYFTTRLGARYLLLLVDYD